MKKIFCLLFSLFVSLFLLYSQHIKSEVTINKEIPVEVKRLSERVLVLTDVSPNGVVTAISMDKGIIIIDTGVSWSFGKGFRRIVEHEFKRNDFIYVINTHADRDHTFGNQAFKDAIIVGHENCYKSLQRLKMEWDAKKNEYVSLHKSRAEKNIQEFKETIFNSDQVSRKRRLVATNKLIASNLSEGQEIILPTLTFNDQMTLHSGNITLHLYYLGEGHSDCDILIYVPQENLIVVGDALIKSMLICYMKQDKFDMSRYSEILNAVLNDSAQIQYAVCGHGSIMTFDELLARRDYLNDLLKGIKQGYVNGMDLELISKRFPLNNYSYLTRFINKSSIELKDQHTGIIEKYWSMLHGEGPNEQ
jgi:glyoxylase-like metal-dependent hydrolase (beta-lactamase superfamily II)